MGSYWLGTDFRMNRNKSDWFGMNFNPKLSTGIFNFRKSNILIPDLDLADNENQKINCKIVICNEWMYKGVKSKNSKIWHLPLKPAADYVRNLKFWAPTTPSNLRIYSTHYYAINEDTPIHCKHEQLILWNSIETSKSAAIWARCSLMWPLWSSL